MVEMTGAERLRLAQKIIDKLFEPFYRDQLRSILENYIYAESDHELRRRAAKMDIPVGPKQIQLKARSEWLRSMAELTNTLIRTIPHGNPEWINNEFGFLNNKTVTAEANAWIEPRECSTIQRHINEARDEYCKIDKGRALEILRELIYYINGMRQGPAEVSFEDEMQNRYGFGGG